MRETLRRKGTSRKGFTLAEVLAVTAITVILFGIGFVAIFRYQRSLKFTEMKSDAREVFLAAQNSMTTLDTSDQWYSETQMNTLEGKGLVHKMEEPPKDWPSGPSWEESESGMYYITHTASDPINASDNEVLNKLLGFGSIDSTISEGGSYIIEFNVNTATVYGVFYADLKVDLSQERSFTQLSDTRKNEGTDKFRDPGTGKRTCVGYYGGATSSFVGGKGLKQPDVKVYNSDLDSDHLNPDLKDTLTVEVNDPNSNSNKLETQLTIFVDGESSKETAEFTVEPSKQKFSITGAKDTKISIKNIDVSPSEDSVIYKIKLDDIYSPGSKFSELFENFLPGENISVTARISSLDKNKGLGRSSRTVVTNSLFASISKDKDSTNDTYYADVKVRSPRQLQNLAPYVSNVGFDYSKSESAKAKMRAAKLKSLSKKTGTVKYAKLNVEKVTISDDIDWSVNSSKTVYPYRDDKSKGNTGKFYSINNNTILSVSGVINEDVTEEDARKSESNRYMISNLDIISDQEYAGLFGQTGSRENKDNDFDVSDLNLVDTTVNGSGYAGALIGKSIAKKTTVTNVSVYDSSNEKYWDNIIRSSGTDGDNAYGIAGGLIGEVSNHTSLNNVSASVQVEGFDIAGGLIGNVVSNQLVITKTYAGGNYDQSEHKDDFNVTATANEAYAGGLIGNVSDGTQITLDNVFSVASVSVSTDSDAAGSVGGMFGYLGPSSLTYSGKNYVIGVVNYSDDTKSVRYGSFAGNAADGISFKAKTNESLIGSLQVANIVDHKGKQEKMHLFGDDSDYKNVLYYKADDVKFATDGSVDTISYNRNDEYPYYSANLAYHGDWPNVVTIPEPVGDFGLVYYEIVSSDDNSNEVSKVYFNGYAAYFDAPDTAYKLNTFNVRTPDEAEHVDPDTGLVSEKGKYVIESGYMILTPDEDGRFGGRTDAEKNINITLKTKYNEYIISDSLFDLKKGGFFKVVDGSSGESYAELNEYYRAYKINMDEGWGKLPRYRVKYQSSMANGITLLASVPENKKLEKFVDFNFTYNDYFANEVQIGSQDTYDIHEVRSTVQMKKIFHGLNNPRANDISTPLWYKNYTGLDLNGKKLIQTADILFDRVDTFNRVLFGDAIFEFETLDTLNFLYQGKEFIDEPGVYPTVRHIDGPFVKDVEGNGFIYDVNFEDIKYTESAANDDNSAFINHIYGTTTSLKNVSVSNVRASIAHILSNGNHNGGEGFGSGVIGEISGATIDGLRISDVSFELGGNYAIPRRKSFRPDEFGIIGWMSGVNINNCEFTNINITSQNGGSYILTGNDFGVIARTYGSSSISNTKFSNIHINGFNTDDNHHSVGIIGHAQGLTLDNVTFGGADADSVKNQIEIGDDSQESNIDSKYLGVIAHAENSLVQNNHGTCKFENIKIHNIDAYSSNTEALGAIGSINLYGTNGFQNAVFKDIQIGQDDSASGTQQTYDMLAVDNVGIIGEISGSTFSGNTFDNVHIKNIAVPQRYNAGNIGIVGKILNNNFHDNKFQNASVKNILLPQDGKADNLGIVCVIDNSTFADNKFTDQVGLQNIQVSQKGTIDYIGIIAKVNVTTVSDTMFDGVLIDNIVLGEHSKVGNLGIIGIMTDGSFTNNKFMNHVSLQNIQILNRGSINNMGIVAATNRTVVSGTVFDDVQIDAVRSVDDTSVITNSGIFAKMAGTLDNTLATDVNVSNIEISNGDSFGFVGTNVEGDYRGQIKNLKISGTALSDDINKYGFHVKNAELEVNNWGVIGYYDGSQVMDELYFENVLMENVSSPVVLNYVAAINDPMQNENKNIFYPVKAYTYISFEEQFMQWIREMYGLKDRDKILNAGIFGSISGGGNVLSNLTMKDITLSDIKLPARVKDYYGNIIDVGTVNFGVIGSLNGSVTGSEAENITLEGIKTTSRYNPGTEENNNVPVTPGYNYFDGDPYTDYGFIGKASGNSSANGLTVKGWNTGLSPQGGKKNLVFDDKTSNTNAWRNVLMTGTSQTGQEVTYLKLDENGTDVTGTSQAKVNDFSSWDSWSDEDLESSQKTDHSSSERDLEPSESPAPERTSLPAPEASSTPSASMEPSEPPEMSASPETEASSPPDPDETKQ